MGSLERAFDIVQNHPDLVGRIAKDAMEPHPHPANLTPDQQHRLEELDALIIKVAQDTPRVSIITDFDHDQQDTLLLTPYHAPEE